MIGLTDSKARASDLFEKIDDLQLSNRWLKSIGLNGCQLMGPEHPVHRYTIKHKNTIGKVCHQKIFNSLSLTKQNQLFNMSNVCSQ